MKRSIVFLFLLLHFAAIGQVRTWSAAQRKAQQEYIRRDTLPVDIDILPNSINTPFSEYAGVLYPDSTFLFTSMRADATEDWEHYFETSWYCNIYASKLLDDGTYLPADPLPIPINNLNTFNSNFFYSPADRSLIYSRCKRNTDGGLQCELWESRQTKKGWEKPRRLPSVINEAGSTTMQPFVVTLPDHKILYFVSNRKNGVGGLDIWYSIVRNGTYGAPINAGNVINTEGNEITPFYDTARSTLYFSSDEHLGIGDYDIFYSEGALSQWSAATNLGVPFNSEYNDYYYVQNPDGRSGYFSSNRPHGEMNLGDTCCNDLFHFEWQARRDTTPVLEPRNSVTLAEQIERITPIALYFGNDEPDPRSTSDSTRFDYVELYRNYMASMQRYLERSGEAQQISFFTDSIHTEYERLQQLTGYLKKALERGMQVTISVSGYASPLHNPSYNEHLSARRIVSFFNHLRKSHDGFFAPYMDGTRTGLTCLSNPKGAVNHEFQSDRIEESVYGLQAAKDRKIIISVWVEEKRGK